MMNHSLKLKNVIRLVTYLTGVYKRNIREFFGSSVHRWLSYRLLPVGKLIRIIFPLFRLYEHAITVIKNSQRMKQYFLFSCEYVMRLTKTIEFFLFQNLLRLRLFLSSTIPCIFFFQISCSRCISSVLIILIKIMYKINSFYFKNISQKNMKMYE